MLVAEAAPTILFIFQEAYTLLQVMRRQKPHSLSTIKAWSPTTTDITVGCNEARHTPKAHLYTGLWSLSLTSLQAPYSEQRTDTSRSRWDAAGGSPSGCRMERWGGSVPGPIPADTVGGTEAGCTAQQMLPPAAVLRASGGCTGRIAAVSHLICP